MLPRRFGETLQAAKGGDANSMELLAQMLSEGYGCQKDVAQARAGERTQTKGGPTH